MAIQCCTPGRLVRIMGLAAAFVMLFSVIFSMAAFAEVAPSEEEAVYQYLLDFAENQENREISDAIYWYDKGNTGLNIWQVYASTGKKIVDQTGETASDFQARFGVMNFGYGITPCLFISGKQSDYIDFACYVIKVGDKLWTIDLTRAPLYSICSQYSIYFKAFDKTYSFLSIIPLGSEGVQMIKALKASGFDFYCRLYVTEEEYYETTADADPRVGKDLGFFYDCVVKSGYLDTNGDVSEHTRVLLKAIDDDASLPKVLAGSLTGNISQPIYTPQSITPEDGLSHEYWEFISGDDDSPEISINCTYRNTSNDKTLDGYTMIYYFTDFGKHIIEVDGQKMITQIKSGLNVAPGETVTSGNFKITDRAHIKHLNEIITQTHYSDGTQVDVPKPNYQHFYSNIAPMPQKIAIAPNGTKTMDAGSTAQLAVTFKPAYADTPITWKSSDESIATVDENGMVTAHMAGSVKIYAEASNGKKATKQIKVVNLVHALEIQGGDRLISGASLTLAAIVSDPENPTNGKVIWRSSDKSVATVSASGKVTAKNVSKTTTVSIIATAADGSGVFAEKTMTIYPAPKKVDITVNDGKHGSNMTLEMSVGETIHLDTEVFPADANQAVTWSTSEESIISVSADGAVTANKAGKSVVTAQAENGKSAKITIRVVEKK